jgi:hypothetical protein
MLSAQVLQAASDQRLSLEDIELIERGLPTQGHTDAALTDDENQLLGYEAALGVARVRIQWPMMADAAMADDPTMLVTGTAAVSHVAPALVDASGSAAAMVDDVEQLLTPTPTQTSSAVEPKAVPAVAAAAPPRAPTPIPIADFDLLERGGAMVGVSDAASADEAASTALPLMRARSLDMVVMAQAAEADEPLIIIGIEHVFAVHVPRVAFGLTHADAARADEPAVLVDRTP